MQLGGNIGKAVLELEPFAADLTYVLELSSYQIDLAPSLALDAAAMLNITPDHLDRHGTFANYARIKSKIFANLGAGRDRRHRRRRRGLARHRRQLCAGPSPSSASPSGHPVETGVFAKDGVLHEVEARQRNGARRSRRHRLAARRA